VDGEDPRFRRGVEFMLGDTAGSLSERLATNRSGWSCLYGNILRYVCQAGLSGDDGAAALMDYSLRETENGNCRCDWNDGHACAWGVARTLWGLAALPQAMRGQAVQQAAGPPGRVEAAHQQLHVYRPSGKLAAS